MAGRFQSPWKRVVPSLPIWAGLTLLGLIFYWNGWLYNVEFKLYDWRMQLLPSHTSTRDIVLVHVSQESLDNYLRDTQGEIGWPWPREFYRSMLAISSKSRVVLFDILFEAPSARGADQDDAEFAKGLKSYGRAVLASAHVSNPAKREVQAQVDAIMDPYQVRVDGADRLDASQVVEVGIFTPPTPLVRNAAASLAAVPALHDGDHILRRYPLIVSMRGKYFPTLGTRALMMIKGVDKLSITSGGHLRLHIGDLEIPIDPSGSMLLHFYGPRLTVPHRPMDKLIKAGFLLEEMRSEGKTQPSQPLPVTPEELEGKILIAGTTAPGLMDHVSTPTDATFPGAEMHATAIANALAYGEMTPPNAWVTILAIVLIGLGAPFLFLRTGTYAGLALLGAVLAAVVGTGVLTFANDSWFEIWHPSLVLLVTFGGCQVHNYLTEGRLKSMITRTFKRYVAPSVVDRLISDPKLVEMMGQRMRLTIMFLDFEGFTKLSEKLDPQELMELLNSYHRIGVGEIFETGGTFDKFMGDAIMAYWGAPAPLQDQALRACRTAVGIQARMLTLQSGAQGGKLLRARIGINTGECIWGNVGQGDLQNISIIGDEVNLTSRLEGANKAFGTRIMISDSTYQEARDRLVVREIGPVRVVGKQKPVRTYELLGIRGQCDEAVAAAFSDAWKRFYARDFAGAREIFGRFDDKLSKKCAEQCAKLIENPPGENWEYVIDIESK